MDKQDGFKIDKHWGSKALKLAGELEHLWEDEGRKYPYGFLTLASFILENFTPKEEDVAWQIIDDVKKTLGLPDLITNEAYRKAFLAEISRLKEIEKKYNSIQVVEKMCKDLMTKGVSVITNEVFNPKPKDKQEDKKQTGSLPPMPPVPEKIDLVEHRINGKFIDVPEMLNQLIECVKDLRGRVK